MTLVKWKTGNSLLDDFNHIDSIFENNYQLYDYSNQFNYDWSPSFDIKEHDKSYSIVADMPGLDKKNININIDEDILIIEGNRKLESGSKDKWFCREIQYGNFNRRFYLPDNINKDEISASLKNGVLKIDINKMKSIKQKLKKIDII